jgi:hypothetical protein
LPPPDAQNWHLPALWHENAPGRQIGTQIGDAVQYQASRLQRIGMATVWGLFFFLETGAFSARNGTQPGEMAFTSAFLAVIAVLMVRAVRSGTILADDSKVVVRSLLRTRSWRWDRIDRFVVDTRLVGGFIKYRRRMLGIREAGGKTRWLAELNCRPATQQRRSWVDDAADALNAQLAAKTEMARSAP